MKQIEEKTIITQVRINLNFLAAFTEESKTNKAIKDFFDRWQKSIGCNKKEPYSLLNQGVILTSLYGLIVYPKEIFFNNIPATPIENLKEEKWGKISIEKCPQEDKNLRGIIRRIRNSLSHARFTIYENLNFTFEDGKCKDNTIIVFRIDDLQKFIVSFIEGCIKEKWE